MLLSRKEFYLRSPCFCTLFRDLLWFYHMFFCLTSIFLEKYIVPSIYLEMANYREGTEALPYDIVYYNEDTRKQKNTLCLKNIVLIIYAYNIPPSIFVAISSPFTFSISPFSILAFTSSTLSCLTSGISFKAFCAIA